MHAISCFDFDFLHEDNFNSLVTIENLVLIALLKRKIEKVDDYSLESNRYYFVARKLTIVQDAQKVIGCNCCYQT